jgi:hypothetical protein
MALSAGQPLHLSKNGSDEITIRICPPLKGRKFCTRIRNHSVNNRIFQCHKKLEEGKWEGKCVCCDAYNKYGNDFWGDPWSGDDPNLPPFYKGSIDSFRFDLTKIKPIERYYFNIVVRGEEEHGVSKWSCHKSVYIKIIEGIEGNESNPNMIKLGNITNPLTGNDFHIRRSRKYTDSGSWYDYSSSQFLPSSPLGTSEQIDKWLSCLYDLEKIRILSPEEEMIEALEATFGSPNSSFRRQFRSISAPFKPAW